MNLLYWTSSREVAVHSNPNCQDGSSEFQSRVQTLAIRLNERLLWLTWVTVGLCSFRSCISQSNTISLLETSSHILGLIGFYIVNRSCSGCMWHVWHTWWSGMEEFSPPPFLMQIMDKNEEKHSKYMYMHT